MGIVTDKNQSPIGLQIGFDFSEVEATVSVTKDGISFGVNANPAIATIGHEVSLSNRSFDKVSQEIANAHFSEQDTNFAGPSYGAEKRGGEYGAINNQNKPGIGNGYNFSPNERAAARDPGNTQPNGPEKAMSLGSVGKTPGDQHPGVGDPNPGCLVPAFDGALFSIKCRD